MDKFTLMNIFTYLLPTHDVINNKSKNNITLLNTLIKRYNNYEVFKEILKTPNIKNYNIIYDDNAAKYCSFSIYSLYYSKFYEIKLNINDKILKYLRIIPVTTFNLNAIYKLNYVNNIDEYINNITLKFEEIKTSNYKILQSEIDKIKEKIFLKFIFDSKLHLINEILILINHFELNNNLINLETNYPVFFTNFLFNKLNEIILFCESEINDSVMDRGGIHSEYYRYLRVINQYFNLGINLEFNYTFYGCHRRMLNKCRYIKERFLNRNLISNNSL